MKKNTTPEANNNLQTLVETNDFIKQLSIDCVIFGFHNKSLKVLMLKYFNMDIWALPGDLSLKMKMQMMQHTDYYTKELIWTKYSWNSFILLETRTVQNLIYTTDLQKTRKQIFRKITGFSKDILAQVIMHLQIILCLLHSRMHLVKSANGLMYIIFLRKQHSTTVKLQKKEWNFYARIWITKSTEVICYLKNSP